MPEQEPRGISRRTLLKGGVGLGVTAAIDQSPRLLEVSPPSQSEIHFDERQQERLKYTNSVCLIFGGSNFRSPERLNRWLSPALEPLGAVGEVRYAKDGLDPSSIADGIQRQHQQGITEFSFYLHSLGAQVLGKVLKVLDNRGVDITIKQLLLDSTPPSLDYLDHKTLAHGISGLPPGGIITGGANLFVFHNPIAEGSAHPDLFDDQLLALQHGEGNLRPVSEAVKRHGSRVTLLTPLDPEKDILVDARASQARLYDFFPMMRVSRVGGKHQQHAVSDLNKDDYHNAINLALG